MCNILKYRLKQLREHSKKTFRELATKCQVTEMTYRNWENYTIDADASIPSDKLLILADQYDCQMEDLYTKEYHESVRGADSVISN
jgi:transcriptional regulator with XRE-family HTH domain